MAPVLPQLGELPAALLALPLQVLLHAALLAVRGLLHVPPVQGLLVELLPTHVTPARRGEGQQHTGVASTFSYRLFDRNYSPGKTGKLLGFNITK